MLRLVLEASAFFSFNKFYFVVDSPSIASDTSVAA